LWHDLGAFFLSVISFQNIKKYFGHRTLFENLSFEINGGELVALTGPSGVGKSTLISLLIGAEKPDGGKILIDGIELSRLSPNEIQMLRRSIGIIFQDFKLLRRKTVFENIAFAMEANDATDDEIENRVPELLKKVNLSGFENKFPETLSGGESQRVAIARALAHRPKLILADEPTGNLDPKNAHEIGEILKNLNETDGLTILLATHDKDLVDFLRPRVLLFQNGEIIRDEKNSEFLPF